MTTSYPAHLSSFLLVFFVRVVFPIREYDQGNYIVIISYLLPLFLGFFFKIFELD